MSVPDYRHYTVPTNRLASFGVVLEHLQPGPALDIGCADGGYLELLGSGSVGVDLSTDNVQLCRARGLNVVEADFSRGLPFEDGVFQSVLCSHVLEHMENPLALLREIHRVVSPGGHIAVGVPEEHSVVRWLQRSHYYDGHPGHLYSFSRDGLRRLAEVAEFSEVRIICDPPLARRMGHPEWTKGFNRLPESLRSALTFNLWLIAAKSRVE